MPSSCVFVKYFNYVNDFKLNAILAPLFPEAVFSTAGVSKVGNNETSNVKKKIKKMQATYILQKVKYCFYNTQILSVHSAILNSVLTRFIQLDTNTKEKKNHSRLN